MSRRAADAVIAEQRVRVNSAPGQVGQEIHPDDTVTLDGQALIAPEQHQTIMLNKPAGYVCSRHGQGSQTIYDLLPTEYHRLKPVGRLDKDSSGLLLLTDDGRLANQLTHPSFQKEKVYEIELDKPLTDADKTALQQGVQLEDSPSRLAVTGTGPRYQVRLSEGRNRQIRRTFAALSYTVTKLRRTHFGPYTLDQLPEAQWKSVA